MKEKRMDTLYYKLLEYVSNVESGDGLYDCLHNFVGMTNAEIEEAGYELQEYYQPERAEQLAAANDKRYISLEELERQARTAVEFIVMDGTTNTSSGNWILSFDELKKQTGLDLSDKPFFRQLIGTMLCERPEVADLDIGTDCLDVVYYLDYCPNHEPEQAGDTEPEAEKQTLRDLLHARWEDIHLLHKDVEIEPATIVELDQNTLTDAGKEAWADVLDAKVCRVYQGAYGLQVELDGVYPARLQEFSEVLAGYCPTTLYDEWVAQPEEAPAQSPEMKL